MTTNTTAKALSVLKNQIQTPSMCIQFLGWKKKTTTKIPMYDFHYDRLYTGPFDCFTLSLCSLPKSCGMKHGKCDRCDHIESKMLKTFKHLSKYFFFIFSTIKFVFAMSYKTSVSKQVNTSNILWRADKSVSQKKLLFLKPWVPMTLAIPVRPHVDINSQYVSKETHLTVQNLRKANLYRYLKQTSGKVNMMI